MSQREPSRNGGERRVDEAFLRTLLPRRKENSSKGDFGRAYLLTGSRLYPGAALLSAEGALRMGVGYTTLFSEREVLSLALVRLPSLLARELSKDGFHSFPSANAELLSHKEKTALLIGCGLSVSDELLSLLYRLLNSEGCPLILDADALNALAGRREESIARLRASGREVLLLPHPLEFARLSGLSVDAVQDDRREALLEYQDKCKVNITLKGFETLTVDAKGQLYRNTTGGTALAKAGTGDVLAGAAAGLAALGLSLADAAAFAVYLHGLAGDRLAACLSDFGVLPSELPLAMARILAEWQGDQK